MKTIEAGSLREYFVRMNIGSKDRLKLQNLQIPEGSTNRTISGWLFPSRFLIKQRLTATRPVAIPVTEMPTKEEISTKRRNATDANPRYALRTS